MMSKILGDGHVRKTGRSCVILEKQHNRLVDLPDSALRLNYEKKYYEPEVSSSNRGFKEL